MLKKVFIFAVPIFYVFITDDSGIRNDHLEPSVGDYEVELLDD